MATVKKQPAKKLVDLKLTLEQYNAWTRLSHLLFISAYGLQRKESVLKSLVVKKLAKMTKGDGVLLFIGLDAPAGMQVRCLEKEKNDAEIYAWQQANPVKPTASAKTKPAKKVVAPAKPAKKSVAAPAKQKPVVKTAAASKRPEIKRPTKGTTSATRQVTARRK